MAFIYDLTDTWNNAAISFNGIKLNATDTASAAGSKLVDLQINGTSKFLVGKTGTVTATGLIESTTGGFRFPDGTTQTTASVGGAGTVTSVTGAGSVSGLTLTGNVTTSGALTLGGTLSLTSGNVTSALGYTPYNATNPSGYITSSALSPYLTSATAATTYQPLDGDLTAIAALAGTVGLIRKTAANTYSLDTDTYLTGITSGQVTTALGYTPYNATNPSGYLSTVSLTANVTGTLPIANGGTGATTAASALTSLGAYPAANPSGYTNNTGTVTSVNITAGTGVSVSGGPITSSGAITVTNTAPDQVVSLTAGTNVTVTGTYPNFTIAAAGGGGGGTVTSIDASGGTTGLTFSGGPITTSGTLTLGGTLDLDNGGTGATDAATARTNLGLATVAATGAYSDLTGLPTLGTLSSQNADAVAITGGTITGVTMDSITNHVGADHIHYKVKATQTLAKGDVVKVVGFNSGEDAFEVAKVSASTDIAVGVIYSALASGAFGSIINTGLLEGIDTSAFAIGTTLYPNTSGGFTSTKPTTGRYQALAFVVRSHANQGTILIEASEPQATSLSQFTNDSGYITGITSSNVTTALGYTPYNATNPSGYTTNTGTVTSVDLTAGTGISVSGGPVTSSGAITVTNSAPDQVVSLTGAGTTVVTGTYPNFTVTSNDSATGTVTSVGGTGTVSGLSLSGSVTTSGNLTLGGTLSLTSGNVTTALGYTPYDSANPTGYITSSALSPYLTSATAATTYQPLDGDLTAIAALAGTSGIVRKTAADTYTLDTATYLTGITSGQVTTALGFTPYDAANPAGYTTNTGTVTSVGGTGTVNGITLTGTVTASGSLTLGGTLSGVDLTTQITGTLPVANGGTGAATLAANNVLLGNGTSALQAVAPGASGNVLTSDGTTWTSSAAAGGAVSYPQNIQSADYTLVLGDAGKQIFHPASDTTGRTYTIPANASVPFPIGTVVLFTVDNGAFPVNVTINSDTLINGSGATGPKYVPANNILQCIKVTATKWMANYLYQKDLAQPETMAVTQSNTPFINAYAWSSSGFGARYADPATLPGGSNGIGVTFSPSGNTIAVTSDGSPFITAYPWSNSGFGPKYANPATLPPFTGRSVAFSPSGNAIAVGSGSTPFILAYPWSGAGFGVNYSNPATLPAGAVTGIAFNPSGDTIAVSHQTTPFIAAYPWSASGFGTKFANPSTLPVGNSNGIAFSPSGDAVAVAHITTPFVTVYPWSASGFGTKFADPATLPANAANGVAFSPPGDAIVVAHAATPFVAAYPWSVAGFGTKFANPATLPTNNSQSVAFSPSGNAVAVTQSTSPYINAYAWSSSGFGARFSNPATLPTGGGQKIAFTVNP